MEISRTNVGQAALYAQDDWNITDNFKLSLGLELINRCILILLI
jgi:outer membrane receptor for ferrienterochelin and colicin